MVDDGRLDRSTTSRWCRRRSGRSCGSPGCWRWSRVHRRPGRHRRAGEPQDLAAQAQRLLAGRGRRLRPAGAERRAGHRRPRLRQVDDGEGDGLGLVAAAAAAGRRPGLRRAGRRAASRTCAPRCGPPRRSPRACCGSTRSRRASPPERPGTGDSGTSARVFGTFLTWMQEKTARGLRHRHGERHRPAAAGDDAQGPVRRDLLHRPADRRRARGDLLAAPEGPAEGRSARWARCRSTTTCWASWCDRDRGFSGAEIEQAVIAACFDAFNERRRADRRRPAARDRQHRAAVGDPGRADRGCGPGPTSGRSRPPPRRIGRATPRSRRRRRYPRSIPRRRWPAAVGRSTREPRGTVTGWADRRLTPTAS